MGEFEDKEFQAIIDKAAIDALYCKEGQGGFDPKTHNKKVKKALDEFDRVLVRMYVYAYVRVYVYVV